MKIITGLLSALSRALRIAQRWVEGPIYQAGYKQATRDVAELLKKERGSVSERYHLHATRGDVDPRAFMYCVASVLQDILGLPGERFKP